MLIRPHPVKNIIAEKYIILKVLGKGIIGVTYAAKVINTKQIVVLKSFPLISEKYLTFSQLGEDILSQLDHPSIPHYLDSFMGKQPEDPYFYIVQEFVPGRSLETLHKEGWQPSLDQIKYLAECLLDVFVYLQNFNPPVFHLEINPRHIILHQDKNKKIQVFLVDFGIIKDKYQRILKAKDIILETSGYLPPEIVQNQVTSGTDLYSLGATLLFLLSGHSPGELTQDQLRVNFRSDFDADQRFMQWLQKMVSPTVENRFTSAAEALEVLRGDQEIVDTDKPVEQRHKPAYSRIKWTRDEDSLTLKVPSFRLQSLPSQQLGIIVFIWTAFLVFIVGSMIRLSLVLNPNNYLWFGGFIIIGLWILQKYIYTAFSTTKIVVTQDYFQLQQWLLGSRYQNHYIENIKKVHITKASFWGIKFYFPVCEIVTQKKKHRFGAFLTWPEQKWMIEEIQDFMVYLQSKTKTSIKF